jgi:hypothetical protein
MRLDSGAEFWEERNRLASVKKSQKECGMLLSKSALLSFGCLLLAVLSPGIKPLCSQASSISLLQSASEKTSQSREGRFRDIKGEWGGQFKFRGFTAWGGERTLFEPVSTGSFFDASSELRIKHRLFVEKWAILETHYEAIFSGGDTRRRGKTLERLFPDIFDDRFELRQPVEDTRRLMDLTKTLDEDDTHILYHRLDRLYLTLQAEWGSAAIGRQAVTWGNGLLFNPMDLFNPFAPSDIERDYKVGDDLLSVRFSTESIRDFQLLYVPRRDPVDREPESNQSSLAGKLRFARGTTEFDLMAAQHFEDTVLGLGSVGYLLDAAWRIDGTWTFLNSESDKNGYFSLVANMDYSWVWWKKNFYGFLEIYLNGLGEKDYGKAIVDPDLSARLDRGELFTLGRIYMATHLQVELHPLFNFFLTTINNLEDPSGLIQPRGVWDVTQNLQMTVGGNIFYGGSDTEFGGFRIPETELFTRSLNSAYLWLTWFF